MLGDALPVGSYVLHSRFRDVVNYRKGTDTLVFLTTRRELIAANGLVVSGGSLPEADKLLISEERITIGETPFDRSGIELFDSALPLDLLCITRFDQSIRMLPDTWGRLFSPQSMLYVLVPERMDALATQFDRLVAGQALRAADRLLEGRVEEGLLLLRGLGRGLTPAGDDFVAGLLYALNIHEHWSGKDHSPQKEQVYAVAKGGNLLVNSGLWQAKSGRCSHLFKNFVLSPSFNGFGEAELRALLSHGATSGADLLAGFIFGIQNRTIIW